MGAYDGGFRVAQQFIRTIVRGLGLVLAGIGFLVRVGCGIVR